MNDKTVLIIGSSGQLGTDMCHRCRHAGLPVIGVDYPQIDITDRASVDRIVADSQPSSIINCAAFTAVDDCESNPDRAFGINATGAATLARAAASAGARMVHISTDYVFDGNKDGPYVETDTPHPKSVYGQSKLEGEQLVAACCADHQIFRIAWLYGLHGKNFVYTIRAAALKKAAAGEPLRVVNDQRGSPTSTSQVVQQIIVALSSELTGVFHATCEGACTWFDFANKIVSAAGIQAHIVPCSTGEFPRPAPRPKNSVLENSRLKKAGIACMSGWEHAFEEFLDHEAAFKEKECSK